MSETEFKSEEERLAAFSHLRDQVHKDMKTKREKPKEKKLPTEIELRLGTYLNAIEPQVRDAVKVFVEKGYSPSGSGFDGRQHSDRQVIYGPLELSEEEIEKLTIAGAEVDIKYPQEIVVSFCATSPDIETIKEQWKHITNALPDRGRLGDPSYSHGFVRDLAPERLDLQEISLRKNIARIEKELTRFENPQ